MKPLQYTVRFNTPAFLGNAEQSGQWRTPPIKAQLRQWWRVAWAADHGYPGNVNGMRTEEGLLFGHAWLENDRDKQGNKVAARKSEIRIRLDHWGEGSLKKQQWPSDSAVTHPEVKNREGQTTPVGSALYLGYGPLEFRGGTALKKNAAIQATESATLSIAVPDDHAPRLERALWLMDRYGALGGRSRNGWGSCALLLLPPGEGRGEGATLAGQMPLRDWHDCLKLDWPHAIGQDDRPLIWQTQPFDDWKALMKRLAEVKIGLRRLFLFPNERPDGEIHERHWLSYPVTKHNVRAWDRNKLRLPNTLRFKVRTTADHKLVGILFHVPHLPPGDFRPDRTAIERVWTQVHRHLDTPAQALTRVPE
jgi:CRISPR-associated protein Cmr1